MKTPLRIILLILALAMSTAAPAELAASAPSANTPAAAPHEDLTTLPTGKGLPVVVHVGMVFQDITGLDDNDGNFVGTVDMRLRWEDPRLRYPASQTISGYAEYRDDGADAKMKQIWVPKVDMVNLQGAPAFQSTSVRIYPDGWVEIMRRVTGQFNITITTDAFPFDTQNLIVDAALRHENNGEAALVFLTDDRDFSGMNKDINVGGWDPGLLTSEQYTIPGWYGEKMSGLRIGLNMTREAKSVVAPVFIPLLASLLIPLLTLWMNGIKEDSYDSDTLALTNVLVGGIFAVIALNLTINSVFKSLASGDNVLTRLFGLNYATLGMALLVIVTMFRFQLPKRLFGWYVEEEIFKVVLWAVPILTFGFSAAFLMLAAT